MRKKIVFVVDNNNEYITQLRRYISLQDDVYIIGTANNGKDALIQIKQIENIDVIITELVLPHKDGFTLLNELNAFYSNKTYKPHEWQEKLLQEGSVLDNF